MSSEVVLESGRCGVVLHGIIFKYITQKKVEKTFALWKDKEMVASMAIYSECNAVSRC